MKPLVWFWCACLLLIVAARQRRPDLSGRCPRSGARSAGRDPWRRSDADQRSDEHRPHDRDQRSRRIRVRRTCCPAATRSRPRWPASRPKSARASRSPRSRSWSWTSRCEVGEFSEQITVDRRGAARRARERHGGDVARPGSRCRTCRSSAATPSSRRSASPNVIQPGRPAVRAHQDQSGASSLSLGGGPRRGNGYLLEGVPITDLRQSRRRSCPRSKRSRNAGADQDLRRGDGPRRRRRVQHDGASPDRTTGTAAPLFVRQAAVGDRATCSSPSGPDCRSRRSTTTTGPARSAVRSSRTRRSSGSAPTTTSRRSTRNNVLTLPTALERSGDFSQTRNAPGRLVIIYDPLTTTRDPATPASSSAIPFPGNMIPANRLNPVALAMLAGMPMPDVGQVVQRRRDARSTARRIRRR